MRNAARLPLPALLLAAVLLMLSACATTSPDRAATSGSGSHRPIPVVASINAWGSLLSQLGGDRVTATSIITNPDTDPHDYEPTPTDARLIAGARLVVENGIGYDTWAAKVVRANPDSQRAVVDVGQVTGTPDDGNPHRWYSPGDVEKVADAITAQLVRADPADADYFAAQRKKLDDTDFAAYHQLIADIRSKYAGTPVGASESIFAPLAEALGLDLVTPPGFLRAISEGSDPSAADKDTIDRQLATKAIKVYVYNSQNATPDVAAQVRSARAHGIQVTTVTETLAPAGSSFQDWQCAQLRALAAALARATGH